MTDGDLCGGLGPTIVCLEGLNNRAPMGFCKEDEVAKRETRRGIGGEGA